MKLKTKTHISLINIDLNELQTKIKQRLQNLEHYERIEKIIKNSSNVYVKTISQA